MREARVLFTKIEDQVLDVGEKHGLDTEATLHRESLHVALVCATMRPTDRRTSGSGDEKEEDG